MRLLIDGYNLLHVTDLFGSGRQAGTLEGSREALLSFLGDRLPAKQRAAATIVFDAAGAPPGLPARLQRHQMQVRFPRGYADADALLEELIEQHRAPRGLLVVSSDHRVQRAARQRGASFQDSLPWFQELARRRPETDEQETPILPLESSDYWSREFTRRVEQAGLPVDKLTGGDGAPPAKKTTSTDEPPGDASTDMAGFPPEYLDELRGEFGEGI